MLKMNNKKKSSSILTCQWCRTCRSAGRCGFPGASAAPGSGPHSGRPLRWDACSPERRWRGSCTLTGCRPQQGSLRRWSKQSKANLFPKCVSPRISLSDCLHLLRSHKSCKQYVGFGHFNLGNYYLQIKSKLKLLLEMLLTPVFFSYLRSIGDSLQRRGRWGWPERCLSPLCPLRRWDDHVWTAAPPRATGHRSEQSLSWWWDDQRSV